MVASRQVHLPFPFTTPTLDLTADFFTDPPFGFGRVGNVGLVLSVLPLQIHDASCVMHGFRVGRVTLGAYLSDCRDWHGKDLYFYSLGLSNIGKRPLRFDLRH
jgi:hypothetical protein